MTQAQTPIQAPASELFEHGALPFTGRARETQLILDFWNATILAERLRALVITGEAGSGKSRLLEAILPHITKSGGLVAHVKLYHDATAAIAPLVLEALRSNNLFHHVSRGGSGSPLSMAAQGLRRIARLRPLLLVIEDIQLLEGEALQELNQLLEMLADEPISALFATRPVKHGARGIVERHLVEEITLGGLQPDEIAEMWRSVMDEGTSAEMLDRLYGATLGNPLALRTVLREALKQERSFPHAATALSPEDRLRQVLEHRVGLLAEGMVAHLSAGELQAARALAAIGEVFSREAAAAILEDAPAMLDRLQGKGIISILTTPALPINDAISNHSLSIFSHSLIHKHLISGPAIAPARLLALLETGAPLYSLLPFQLLTSTPASLPSLDFATLRGLMRRIDSVISRLCDGPDWRLATAATDLLGMLVEAALPGLGEEERMEAMLEREHIGLTQFRRQSNATPEYVRCVERFLELTENPLTEQRARRRICALDNLMALDDVRESTGVHVEFCWKEAEKVLERFPSLLSSSRYIFFLGAVAIYGRPAYNASLLARMAAKMELIEKSPEVSEESRRIAWRKLSPILLRRFSTPEELEGRLRMAAELGRETSIEDWLFLMEEVLLMESIGRMDDALRATERWNAQLMARGMVRTARSCRMVRLRLLAMIGMPLRTVEEEMPHLMIHPNPLSTLHRARFGRGFAQLGLLCGDLAWSRALIDNYPESLPILSPELRIALALDSGDHAPLEALLEPPSGDVPMEYDEVIYFAAPRPDLALLVAALLEKESLDADAVAAAAERIATAHLLTSNDLLAIDAMLSLVRALDARHPALGLTTRLKSTLDRAIQSALDWAVERKLPPTLAMLLGRHAGLLPPRGRTLWRNRLTAIAEERAQALSAGGMRPPVGVTMIGTISVSRQGNEAHRIRGERMRVLLALMVANLLVAKPLDQEEFAAIATGIDDDPEAARLSLTHMVYRLRETIGTQAVVTPGSAGARQGSTPQLNLSIVDVDLLRAWGALQTAHEALIDSFLAKAARSLTEAIDIVGSEIIFPTLYDSFFEALRTDFESRLRGLILSISARLTEEGDSEGASLLLERGFAVMPDDEEVAERLQEALVSTGRNADAERVRGKSDQALRV